MGITYKSYEDGCRIIFKLDTPNTTYMFQTVDSDGFLLHIYYGRRLRLTDIDDLSRIYQHPFLPSENERERASFMDCAPFEYPGHGLGDYRDDAFAVLNENGHSVTSFSYSNHRIYKGKPRLEGMPATFGTEEECETVEIIGTDIVNGLEITLFYTVFNDVDAIAKSVNIRNTGKFENIKLTKVLSSCVEFYGDEYDTIFLHGSWARERIIDRKPLGYGRHCVSSLRGESSHQEHPFIGLVSRNADEDSGDVYGCNFQGSSL